MAEEVNEYFLNKYKDVKRDFQGELDRHRRTTIYKVLIAVAVILVLMLIVFIADKNKIYTDYVVKKTITYEEVGSAKYEQFSDNILRYSRDGAMAFNMNNEMLWNHTYQMQNPLVDICGDYIALGDYRGTRIFVLNSQGIQGTIDTTLPVQRFCISGNGNVAVILEEGDITWVKLYNKDGQNVATDRTTMKKSGYPVSIDISENGILLCVSYIVAKNGEVSSDVAFYNFGAVGQNETDNLVSGQKFQNDTITYIQFMSSSAAFSLGTTEFALYQGSQKPECVKNITLEEEVHSVFYSDKYVGLVFRDITKDDAYRVDVYNTSGNIVMSRDFVLDYTDIKFNKDFIVISNSNECKIYDLSGREKLSKLFNNSIIKMIPTKNKIKYLFVSGEKTDEIELR